MTSQPTLQTLICGLDLGIELSSRPPTATQYIGATRMPWNVTSARPGVSPLIPGCGSGSTGEFRILIPTSSMSCMSAPSPLRALSKLPNGSFSTFWALVSRVCSSCPSQSTQMTGATTLGCSPLCMAAMELQLTFMYSLPHFTAVMMHSTQLGCVNICLLLSANIYVLQTFSLWHS
jgi:hypothetical protein